MQPFHTEEFFRWERHDKSWKVCWQISGRSYPTSAEWLTHWKDQLHTALLYSLHRTFRTLLMVSVYNHQQIISANCFWWIAHHLWDVSWQHPPFSGAPFLAQHFKHRAKTHVVKQIWPKGRTFWHRAEIHDVSSAAWDWCILQNREDFSTVKRFTNHRTLLGKNYCCHLTTYMCKDHCFSHSYIKESPLISYHGVLVSCKMITPPLLSVLKVHWTVWLI